mmetsp:Transcript_30191/g.59265  ORF Transcript_30191/g.59265 Transcript_30191/m.59265 type:complete len:247 (-) Transcript_30191:61-801(-)
MTSPSTGTRSPCRRRITSPFSMTETATGSLTSPPPGLSEIRSATGGAERRSLPMLLSILSNMKLWIISEQFTMNGIAAASARLPDAAAPSMPTDIRTCMSAVPRLIKHRTPRTTILPPVRMSTAHAVTVYSRGERKKLETRRRGKRRQRITARECRCVHLQREDRREPDSSSTGVEESTRAAPKWAAFKESMMAFVDRREGSCLTSRLLLATFDCTSRKPSFSESREEARSASFLQHRFCTRTMVV